MSDKKEIKITVVEFALAHEEGFRKPSKYFIRNSCGDFVYIHSKSRKEAQEWVNDNYCKGKYTVSAAGEEGGNSSSVRCTTNNISRKGTFHAKIKASQGMNL